MERRSGRARMTLRELDGPALRAWCHAAAADLARVREAIDQLNVFPVADADTGGNMHRTMVAAAEAADAPAADVRAAWTATARAAMLGAQGNSGVILSQLLRGLAEHAPATGAELARALEHATDLAYAAVGEPVEGTVLTVARAAASAASATSAATATDPADGPLDAVAAAAARGAREALGHTPEQLTLLADAGVVDAGAAGLVVVLEALARVCAGADPAADHLPEIPARRPGAHRPPASHSGPAYEVMYLLDAPEDAIGPLRETLGPLGDSLVVVGGAADGWSVHVHVDDVGSALLAGVDAGRPHRIRVNHLAGPGQADDPATPSERHVLALVPSAELAELVETSGVRAVRPPDAETLAGAVLGGRGVEVALVPDSAASATAAGEVARRWRDAGARVAVVPSRSVVQALAAVAVHDAEAAWEDDLTAMTAAAAATRHAEIPAGAVDAEDAAVTATRTLLDGVDRGDGALVTLVHGPATPPGLVDAVVDALADAAPGVETAVYAGGPADVALVVGVE